MGTNSTNGHFTVVAYDAEGLDASVALMFLLNFRWLSLKVDAGEFCPDLTENWLRNYLRYKRNISTFQLHLDMLLHHW